jgi:4-diphosphocytidyl-2-C-methyl-D-erythritol kinase
MLLFPNAKINLGLRVIDRREDGYHSIETIFVPVSLCDCLEFLETSGSTSTLEISGTGLEGTPEDNLVLKAWKIMLQNHAIPCVQVHLHKIIPSGAGLGGGSSDAAFMLKGLNEYFSCGCSQKQLETYASQIGSDCAFFIRNRPSLGTGRGEILEDMLLPLQNCEVLLVNPGIHVGTREAYSGVSPKMPEISLKQLIKIPVASWQKKIKNDFEKPVFEKYPLIADLKSRLTEMGAVYASMTGSGSTVYGLFREGELDKMNSCFDEFFTFKGKLITSELQLK